MTTEELVLLIDLLDKLGYNTESAGTGTVFQRLAQVMTNLGLTSDAANASGTALARLAELLNNRLTSARAAKLDYLDGYISAVLNRLGGGTKQAVNIGSVTIPASSSYTILNVTGSGLLTGIYGSGLYTYGGTYVKITVDGIVIPPGGASGYDYKYQGSNFISFPIKFNSSLLIEAINATAGSSAVSCHVNYVTGV